MPLRRQRRCSTWNSGSAECRVPTVKCQMLIGQLFHVEHSPSYHPPLGAGGRRPGEGAADNAPRMFHVEHTRLPPSPWGEGRGEGSAKPTGLFHVEQREGAGLMFHVEHTRIVPRGTISTFPSVPVRAGSSRRVPVRLRFTKPCIALQSRVKPGIRPQIPRAASGFPHPPAGVFPCTISRPGHAGG